MTIFRFKDHVSIIREDGYIYIIDKNVLKISINDGIEQVINQYKQGCNPEIAKDFISIEDALILHNTLQNNNLILPVWDNNYENTFLEKQLYYLEQFSDNPNDAQTKLDKATVGIIGLGGVGSIVLQNLVGAGIKNFVLIDFDNVSMHNLNRQFIFNTSSIGSHKITESSKYAKSINKDCNIICFNAKINELSDFTLLKNIKLDIIVNAADTPYNIAEITYNYAKENKIPFITAGVGISSGFWGPLFNSESYNMNINMTQKHINRDPIKGSLGATNNIISSFMTYDIIKFLIGEPPKSLGKKIIIEFDSLNIKEKNYIDNEEKANE
ncbi:MULTISPECIES: ThiF family adenylyltransferase [Bacillota]|uniref:ThiF family adenylyltransferase n=1 Tax=Bacillota TaxID=1239 RepID=UPI0012B7B3EB|nr:MULTISPECIES: ThiF family adenylyltransferase [Bacillota]MTH08269.1 ThiF family adenylyltransferase [Turicibacter sanguinis]MCU7192789.1 ThiF family adenylyltransferase [Turicibacter sp. T129]MCU7206772.1 ThiF family adenylyltransferase [Turicibacter sp. GALT-G1]MTH11093.1 ThiF family adenylyltransferase [Turicibacter sanguinis]MTH13860.1 ThiF family adenylyltransferase [Turicibacter sanguinis]